MMKVLIFVCASLTLAGCLGCTPNASSTASPDPQTASDCVDACCDIGASGSSVMGKLPITFRSRLGTVLGLVSRLTLRPDGVFAYSASSDSGVMIVSTGRYHVDHAMLELSVSSIKPAATQIATTLHIVQVGERLYLVPVDQIDVFPRIIVEEAERGSRFSMFYLREGDEFRRLTVTEGAAPTPVSLAVD